MTDMQLICHRCEHHWDYKAGKNYAQCPQCKTSVSTSKSRKLQNPIAAEEQPIQNGPPKVDMNEIIISDDFEDVDYINRDPEIINVPHLKKVLYRGRRRRVQLMGNIYKSIPKPPEKPKPNPMEALMAMNYMEQLEQKKEEEKKNRLIPSML